MKMKDEFIPHGYCTISNCGGIEVEINRAGDAVRYRWSYGNPNEKVSRWQKIKETPTGRMYFVCKKRRYYLENFMKY